MPTPANAINQTAIGVSTFTGTAFTAPTLAQYSAIIASTGNGLAAVAPSSTVGVPMISNGSSANPSFGTAVVAGGGTGNTTFTAYSVILAGTTATGAMQNVSGLGTSGQVLTSAGAGAVPVWANAPSGSGFLWASVATAPTTATNRGYMATAALTVTLPTAPADGFIVALLNASAGTVLFQAGTGDSIQVGSTVGASAGSATSTTKGDELTLVYQASGTLWFCVDVNGIWSVA